MNTVLNCEGPLRGLINTYSVSQEGEGGRTRKNTGRNHGQKLTKFNKNYEITDPRSSITLEAKKEENYMTAHHDQMT